MRVAQLVPSWRPHAIRVRCVTACPVPPWAALLHFLQPGPPPPSLLRVPMRAPGCQHCHNPNGTAPALGTPMSPSEAGLGLAEG